VLQKTPREKKAIWGGRFRNKRGGPVERVGPKHPFFFRCVRELMKKEAGPSRKILKRGKKKRRELPIDQESAIYLEKATLSEAGDCKRGVSRALCSLA